MTSLEKCDSSLTLADGLTFMALSEEAEMRKKREEKLLEQENSFPSPLKVSLMCVGGWRVIENEKKKGKQVPHHFFA